MKEPFSSYSKIFTSHNQRNFTPTLRLSFLWWLGMSYLSYFKIMNQIGVRSLFRNIHR